MLRQKILIRHALETNKTSEFGDFNSGIAVFLRFLIFLIVFTVLWFLASILICLWVYRDAKSRRMDPVLWILIILVANFMGLIIYLIVREEKRSCFQNLPINEKRIGFCSNRGSEITLNAKFCTKCGKEVT